MSKQDILAGYLNDSYYGSGAWGIEAAAETYFNTTAAKLTLLQAATLAGIVENPTAVRPDHTTRSTALERRNTVLARIAQTNPTRRSTPADAATRSSDAEAGAAPRHRAERLLREHRRERRLLLRLRDAHAAARHPARRHHAGHAPSCSPPAACKIYTTRRPSRTRPRRPTPSTTCCPSSSKTYNPAHNAATEVLIQPGTGKVTRDRRGPALRHRPRADRGRLRGQHASTAAATACRPVRRPSCSP